MSGKTPTVEHIFVEYEKATETFRSGNLWMTSLLTLNILNLPFHNFRTLFRKLVIKEGPILAIPFLTGMFSSFNRYVFIYTFSCNRRSSH